MRPETEKKEDNDNQYQLIDLDELEFQPIKIKFRGIEYKIESYTCEQARLLDRIEREATLQKGSVEALFEVVSSITGIPMSELDKMEFATYANLRNRLFMGVSLGKKKEPKKSS